MVQTAHGAMKRERRTDGTFKPAPQRERLRTLSVDRKRLLKFRPPALENHTQPASLPPNEGRPPVLPVFTFQGVLSSVANTFRNPDEALRNSRENARYMRNDCSVMECLESRQRAVELLNWHIEPEDGKNKRQIAGCEQLTRLLKKMPNFKKYRHSLLEAVWYGRYANQHRWGWTFDRGRKYAFVEQWTPVNGDKLVFRYDDGTGKYDPSGVGIRVTRQGTPSGGSFTEKQREQIEPTPDGEVYFLRPWERKCLAIHKHIIEDGDFYDPWAAGSLHGVGIRSRIYWTWFQALESQAMLLEFLERVGLGITIYWYPHGNEEARQQVETIAKTQNQNNHILMPRMGGDAALDAYGIERVEPNPGGAQVLQDVIVQLFSHRIKRYILGQTLTTESDGAGLGSSGISDLHKWGFFQIIKSDAIDLEETMTRELVKPLIEFNPDAFADVADCDLRFVIDTEAPDVAGQLEAFEKAFNMGLEIVEADVRDLIGASLPTGDDKTLSLKQLQSANEAMAAAGIGGNLGGQPVGSSTGGADVHGTLKTAFAEHRAEEAAE